MERFLFHQSKVEISKDVSRIFRFGFDDHLQDVECRGYRSALLASFSVVL
jgi:hypothetical protein